jgi:hypothetical protein
MNRVDPVQPPYAPGVAERLEAMMPPGVPPILLFRTFVRNLPMATAMGSWGSYELSRHLSLPMRAREIVIDRTCARCRCEYEWGVHVAFFSERVALSTDQVASLTHGNSSDECWTDDSDRLLIEAVDSLHGSSHIRRAMGSSGGAVRRVAITRPPATLRLVSRNQLCCQRRAGGARTERASLYGRSSSPMTSKAAFP